MFSAYPAYESEFNRRSKSMKRKMIVLAVIGLLMILFSISAAVYADQPPGVPHNGGCVAHCARTAKVDRPPDQDGKAKNCLADTQCILYKPDPNHPCGELFELPDGTMSMCNETCVLIHGVETHGRGN
jgi:hypothetical protein